MNMNKLSASSTSAPPIAVETKFMQNYRVAAPVHAGSQIATVRDATGAVEIFTTADDGTIVNFYPDASSETGYAQISTGLRGKDVAAGVDSHGKIVVFAASGLTLQYVTQTASASRWSSPKQVSVPQPLQASAIVSVIAEEIAGELYVGVLTQFNGAIGIVNSFAYSIWSPDAPRFNSTPLNIQTRNAFWFGSNAAEAAFGALDGAFVAYRVSTGKVEHIPVAQSNRTLGVTATLNGSGGTEIFGVLDDGNAYHLAPRDSGFTWIQLSHGMTFRQIACARDHQGGVEVFAVNGDNRLYHWEPRAQSDTGYTYPPAPIDAVTARISVTGNDAGDIDAFVVGTAQNTLRHLFQQQLTTNWEREPVGVAAHGKVQPIASYTTEVTLFDRAGALLVHSPVVVWTAEESMVGINGGTYFTEPNRPARVSTNATGMLSITQPAGRLSIPRIHISLPATMGPGDSICIDPWCGVKKRLSTITGPDLMSAKLHNGEMLLAPDYRTPNTTDSLAKAFNDLMKLDAPAADAIPYVAQDGPRDGVAFCSTAAMAAPARPAFATRPASWQLSFDGAGATYRALSESEAYALFTTRRATARSADALDWLTDLGDFIEGVAGGVLDVVEYIVTPVGNLVMAGVRFFIESVEYFFEQVIRVVEDAFDIVESVLAKVKVFFERTFEWIGFLFDWTDIVLTHEALSYTIDQTLGFLEGAVSGMQTLVDNGITNVQARLASLFQDAIRNIAQSYSLGGYDDANQQMSPMFSGASANNLLYNALIDNGGSARMTSAPRPLPENNPFGPAMRKLTELADFTRSEAAFSSAVQYFTNLGGSPDQIFAQLLSALMEIAEGLLQAVLSGAKAAVDAVFAVARDIISALRGMLQNEWDIPLVSPLFAYFTNGAKLNTLNLMSIIVAAPTTILYKAVNGQTPFRNEQDVAAFRALFDAQSMIRASGLGGTTSALRIATGGLLPKPLALLVALGHALAQGFFGAMSAVIDFIPKDAPRVLIEITFLLEVASQAFGFPWFNTSGAPDCSTADGAAKFNWIVEDYGLLLDGLFVAFEGRIPENAHDVGVIVAFVYALGHLAMAVVASIPASGIAIAANLTPVIAELGKILRLDGIVSATNRISLPVCAALDAIFFTTGAVLEFIEYATGKPDVAALPVVA